MRLKTRVVCLLLVCCLPAVVTLFYFIAFVDDLQVIFRAKDSLTDFVFQTTRRPVSSLIIVPFTEIKSKNSSLLVARLKRRIEAKVTSEESDESLLPKYRSLISGLKTRDNSFNDSVWALAASWVTARHVIPEEAPLLGQVMRALRESRVLRADVSRKGTQLKLALTLDGGQEVLFKPKRYSRDTIVSGIYSGFDRHNGEIVGKCWIS